MHGDTAESGFASYGVDYWRREREVRELLCDRAGWCKASGPAEIHELRAH